MDKDNRELEKYKNKTKSTPQKRFLSYFSRSIPPYRKELALFGVSMLVALLITPSFTVRMPHYELGDVANHNIKAKRDFLIEDEEATNKKREEAAEASPVIYDLDEKIALDVTQKLITVFETIRKSLEEHHPLNRQLTLPPDRAFEMETRLKNAHPSSPPDPEQQIQGWKKDFLFLLGVDVPDEIIQILVERRFPKDIQDKVLQLVTPVFEQGIVANKALLLQTEGQGLVIRKVRSQDEKVVPPPYYFPDLEEARNFVQVQAQTLSGESGAIKAVSYLASQILQHNLTFNRNETERRKEEAAQAVKPVYIQLKKNEMLVREGQRIDSEALLKLKALDQIGTERHQWLILITIFLFCVLCMWLLVRVSDRRLCPSVKLEFQDLLFLAVLLIFLLALGRFTTWFTDNLGESSLYLSSKTLVYAIPLTAGAMMATILFGVTASLLFSLLVSVFAGMLFGRDFEIFLYFLIGSFVAAHMVSSCRNRMAPIRAGLLVGCTNVVMIVLTALFQEQEAFLKIFINTLFGFSGGVFAGVLATGLTPLVEMAFGYTTDIKLLELATMDQPLLRELMVQAPGTYHHSIIVGNMVEAAANSIGANSLLAKVAAYYHDIGKTKKPLYFIENQLDCENRHEKLAPSMSSLILISHVKEGIELAKQHRLGKPITDIISQHHGTSLIAFFYKKALEAREKAQSNRSTELPPINIDDYRYPGPKPQTKEAGLVMLADIVEAACRSLSEPTPARIQGMVNRLISNVFIDGQLDECELTLKDLHQIAKHFNQILATVHHKRIEYPSTSCETKGKSNEQDSPRREPKPDSDTSSKNRENGRTDLKRLGLQ